MHTLYVWIKETSVVPVGFTQHQSGIDRVEVPLHLSAGRLGENQLHYEGLGA